MIKHFDWKKNNYEVFRIWLSIKYPDIAFIDALNETSIYYKLNEFLEWYANKIEGDGWEIVSIDPFFAREKT